MSSILGKKLKMEQLWQGQKVVPVTVIEVQPNKVALLRTKEKDGYAAVQLKLGKTAREFKSTEHGTRNTEHGAQSTEHGTQNAEQMRKGDEVKVDVFAAGDMVRVSGISKGRGFQGTVKRHGFAGGPKTHGQKNRHRAPGSIGSTAFQRVVPGRRMAGHMGNVRVTLKNLEVIQVDTEKNLLLLKGAVPGPRGGVIEIAKLPAKKKAKK